MTPDPASAPDDESLRVVPLQLVAASDGVVLVRGRTELQVLGERAVQTVKVVLAAAAGADGATRRQICDVFAAPDRPRVGELVDELARRRLLVPARQWPARGADAAETALDVFYWHFGARAEEVGERLHRLRIVIVGVNVISRQLAASLGAAGLDGAELIDYHLLRNLRLFDGSGALRFEEWPAGIRPPLDYDEWAERLEPEAVDCLVAASDFGGPQLLSEWNGFCVAHGRPFLPIVLDRLIGSVGPFVIPGETACYECLRAREDSHLEDAELRSTVESAALGRQSVAGFHPSMAAILAEIAHMEITKFFSGVMPYRVGRLVEVNMLTSETRARRVLKLPRCPVCSAVARRSPTSLDKNTFVPGHPVDHSAR